MLGDGILKELCYEITHHPLCRRSHAELFYVDLLQFLLRPDLGIYSGNKKVVAACSGVPGVLQLSGVNAIRPRPHPCSYG